MQSQIGECNMHYTLSVHYVVSKKDFQSPPLIRNISFKESP